MYKPGLAGLIRAAGCPEQVAIRYSSRHVFACRMTVYHYWAGRWRRNVWTGKLP